MSTNSPSAPQSAPYSNSVPQPSSSSAVRLIVLLLVLGLVIAALVHDYAVAGPASEAANKKLDAFVDERNKLGVKEGGIVTQADVQKELGRKPTRVDKHDEHNYEVEFYCWRPLPVVNMMKHYIAVVYVGEGATRRISSHYLNSLPPPEALPVPDKAPAASSGESMQTTDGGEAASGESPAKKSDQDSAPAPAKASDSPDSPAEKGN